jgi:hypothetical protein
MDKELMRIGRLSLVKSTPQHAETISNSLRFNDRRECMIYGTTPLEALTEPLVITGAKTFTLKLDNDPIAMTGSVPIEQEHGRIWMLGTGAVNNNFRPFLRGCRPVIDLLQKDYESLENYVPIDHHDTIMWLSWCGFTFDEGVYEICGHSMMRFVRCVNEKNNVYYFDKRPVMH